VDGSPTRLTSAGGRLGYILRAGRRGHDVARRHAAFMWRRRAASGRRLRRPVTIEFAVGEIGYTARLHEAPSAQGG
jgi:hypothetical protein